MKTKLPLLLAFLCTFTSKTDAATESITLTLPPGFCLLANHLDHGDNSLNTILPNVPAETQVLKFANNNYTASIFDGTTWLDALTGEPSRVTVSPGQGFFLFNPVSSNLVVTFTGEARQGVQIVCFPPGFSLVGSPLPEPFVPNSTNGFPRVLEMMIWRYVRACPQGCPTYRILIVDGGYFLDYLSGNPASDSIPVGEGFFVFNPGGAALCWTRDWTP